VISGTDVVAFTYDGDGHRLGKVVNGEAMTYTTDLNTALPQVLAETQLGQTTAYVYGAGLNSIAEPGAGWRYYHADGWAACGR